MMDTSEVGLIGVGMMGHGIARNILRSGWRLRYLSHPGNQPTEDLDAAGAVGHETARSLAEQCDLLILCVTGTPQVEDVLTGSGQVLSALRPGSVVIDCSTAIPESTEDLARQVEARGADLVDAAMTRTPAEAAAGRLNLLIGGRAEAVDRIMPLLETFSENRFHAGPPGAGHRLKLLHNFVSLGSAALIAEASACARASGMDDAVLIDCLRRGGGHGAALERIAPYLTEGRTDQMRFSVANAQKDLGYYERMAEALGAEHAIASSVAALIDRLDADGHGQEMMPRMVDLLNAKTGRD
ncbi:3-hydroxyisobutyrate dehydrogenase [Paracoccus isoporae]|uniref:3-hydroxyisobutyrate dehydrogenase n=1 Tax=Paracoccus isoporae TaxID=591205 RepID=A0A1G6U157_9RHOB|nr:NAD(P)-dependent oxidoreductase [Paracoccus isoporae]SDD35069.1 3-hydroxyisobutyrate dehydrogenase [Paracoccus isoporae]